MPFRTKFLISFQHSGRRWFCNVLGHYDQYLLDLDPAGTWVKGQNPLKKYGTDKRWNIVLSHCNTGVGKDILVPRFYRFRPAVILVRHPAKVICSMYRGRKAKIPEFNLSPEEFTRNGILDFLISYSNSVYSCIGQANKIFAPYNRLYSEQFENKKEEWSRVVRFFFGTVDDEIMRKAILNNVASNNYADGVKRHNRAEPSTLGQLTNLEKEIRELIKSELSSRLYPDICRFFEDNEYI